jgi:hypothetical protein
VDRVHGWDRRRLALSVAALGVTALLITVPGRAAGRSCGPHEARTLAHDTAGRVYAVGPTVSACANVNGHTFTLGTRTSCIGADLVGPFAMGGGVVAVADERCGVDTGMTHVLVRRLRDGHVLATGFAAATPGPESHTTVTALVVKSDAAVGWIARASSVGGHTLVQVRRLDRHGARVLDSGGAVRIGSLQLHGSTMSWLHGTTTRRATLD